MTKYVYTFAEGDRDMRDLLGGKNANLTEVVKLGPPVPPGFTVITGTYRTYLTAGESPETLDVEVMFHSRNVEQEMGKRLGDKDDPPLASVRSGTKLSIPEVMETVLSINLDDESVQGLVTQSNNKRFAWDSCHRLIRMFGRAVQNINGDKFTDIFHKLQAGKGYPGDLGTTANNLKHLVEELEKVIKDETSEDLPQDPCKQLDLTVETVFHSWSMEHAHLYRRRGRIPNELGIAVNVCMVVLGDISKTSGTGVCFIRNPSTDHSDVYSNYLVNTQDEDVVVGIRSTLSLANLRRLDEKSCDELRTVTDKLGTHYRGLCDIEFTIQQGKLWVLQTRVSKCIPAAVFRMATQLVDERLIASDKAVTCVMGDQLTSLLFPQFDKNAEKKVLTKDMSTSPGAIVGETILSNEQATSHVAAGASVILVCRKTNPNDLADMVAAPDVLIARDGKTLHVVVVTRGMGHCCIVGAKDLVADEEARVMRVRSRGATLKAGDVVAIDGITGKVFRGEVLVVDSPVMTYIAHGLDATLPIGLGADTEELVHAVDRVLTQVDEKRNLAVCANADTPGDAERTRSFGAQGAGLCRTKHMFLDDRHKFIRPVILAGTAEEQEETFNALRPLQESGPVSILTVADGLPATIRFIGSPLHEFLPDLTELSVELAVRVAYGEGVTKHEEHVLEAIKTNHEQNPMLGLRGMRLGLKIRDLFKLRIRAIVEAAVRCEKKDLDPRLGIMASFTDSEHELQITHDDAERIIGRIEKGDGVELGTPISGTIELPRAVPGADRIIIESGFPSFGADDPTQTMRDFSRDDVEASFFNEYFNYGIFGTLPFETIDASGVGQLVETGVTHGCAAKPGLKCSVCGRHGDDPASVHLFDKLGLSYVSYSPFHVPVARLELGHAAISSESANAGR